MHVIETGLVAVLGIGNLVFTPSPWTIYDTISGSNTFGDFWGYCISTEPINGAGQTVSMVSSSGGGVTAWGAIALSLQMPDPTVAAVVTVIEAFDDIVQQDQASQFTVGLPQLGPHGRQALQDLLARVNAQSEPPGSTDETPTEND